MALCLRIVNKVTISMVDRILRRRLTEETAEYLYEQVGSQ